MRSPTLSIVKQCFLILSTRDRKKVAYVSIIQAGLSILDLVGVALIGVIGALAVNGISSQAVGNRTRQVLEFMNLSSASIQEQTAIIAGIATVFLITKTFITALLSRRIAYFLSAKSALISAKMNHKVMSDDLELITETSMMSLLYALTNGVQAVTVGIIASSVALSADLFMILVILTGLIFVDKIVALSAIGLFGGIGFALYLLQQKRAITLGRESADLNVEGTRLLMEEISAYREIFVRNRIDFYAERIKDSRSNLSRNIAEMSFLPSISKYVMEIAIVLSMMLIAGMQFVRTDAAHAVATLALFLAASSRFVPAILRVQQALLTIRNSIGSADPTLKLYRELFQSNLNKVEKSETERTNLFNDSIIELKNVSFAYKKHHTEVIKDIDLKVKTGEFVAIAGPSGAGKSTLVDLILGLLTPSRGEVKMMGISPRFAISEYPGLIGYVPQSVFIKHGTIAENIAFGFPPEEIDFLAVEKALSHAQLSEFVANLESGVETFISEEGKNLSGGQKQRMGIARALYTNPQILVLDEATSALDGATENEIATEILRLRESKTVIVIAHRLSTIRLADTIYYVDNGKILASGNFEELKKKLPEFEKQANLMGL